MEAKKTYTRPELKSREIELGVFGSYCDQRTTSKTDSREPDMFRNLIGPD